MCLPSYTSEQGGAPPSGYALKPPAAKGLTAACESSLADQIQLPEQPERSKPEPIRHQWKQIELNQEDCVVSFEGHASEDIFPTLQPHPTHAFGHWQE